MVRSPSQVGQAWQLGSATTSIATKATYIEGDGVPIWWQNSDSSVLAQASATTTSMTSGASPSPSSTGTTSTPDSGLSSGTKIGLGVGLAIAGVLLGLLALFFVRKRRREHAEAERHGLLPAGETKHESNATEIYQLDATPPSHELFNSGEAWHQRHELPGAPKK